MIKNIEIEKAKKVLIENSILTKTENVFLENSLNRIIATDIYSKVNVPSFKRSPLDGYALSSKDTFDITKNGKIFDIFESIQAGDTQVFYGVSGKVVKLTTGCPIPIGYDCVIKMEDVEVMPNAIRIFSMLKKDENIVAIGEDIKLGELLIKKGELLNPGKLGVLSSLGIEKVKVYKKITVGILSTGNELMELGSPLKRGQIYNSNYFSIMGSCINLGCNVKNLGVIDDDINLISQTIENNMSDIDILITTGGASVGEYDLIEKVYKNIKSNILFSRVKMKPGTPMLSSVYKDKILIGLSGNPGAALISFEELVKPVLKYILGYKDFRHKKIKAIVKNDYLKKSIQRRLLRGILVLENENNYVKICENQKPGVLKSIVDGNVLIDIPEKTPFLKKGDIVDVILID